MLVKNLTRSTLVDGAIKGIYDILPSVPEESMRRNENPPGGSTDVPELQGLLWREIDQNVTVRSGVFGILDRLLLSVSNQWVIVAWD